MTNTEGTDLHKRVERYEAAIQELRASHDDIRYILMDQVLYERWRQVGAELGFTAAPLRAGQPQRDLAALNQQIPEMSEAWAS